MNSKDKDVVVDDYKYILLKKIIHSKYIYLNILKFINELHRDLIKNSINNNNNNYNNNHSNNNNNNRIYKSILRWNDLQSNIHQLIIYNYNDHFKILFKNQFINENNNNNNHHFDLNKYYSPLCSILNTSIVSRNLDILKYIINIIFYKPKDNINRNSSNNINNNNINNGSGNKLLKLFKLQKEKKEKDKIGNKSGDVNEENDSDDHKKFDLLDYILGLASTKGYLELVKYIHWLVVVVESDNEDDNVDNVEEEVEDDESKVYDQLDLESRYEISRICRKFCSKQQLFNSNILDCAAISGNLQLVRFLHGYAKTTDGSCSFSVSAIDGAAVAGHIEVVQFLYENRTEGCTSYALVGAASNGHCNVVSYLLKYDNESTNFKNINGAIMTAIINGQHECFTILSSYKTNKFT
ncbi:hypothetical protein PPL_05398 [Heterostelium album PN500]|uniref:Ankyrin repeat-containing protein n=1 Tax=Heterostelium pallidum (strain ATCC 26659 / Pp 5 / PN500) TaxID=670386 RepID=D3BA26_HETP5|nr:hypothetical protein PPL_05398 [Heterostelium album PN500]EFA81413.1 hypothetical protein PPL_05398 [Heterostelium album PN500]|eukprot:XP_020433531.1 hypothetical protein PPL_05398 [Heterostelium album PN500]